MKLMKLIMVGIVTLTMVFAQNQQGGQPPQGEGQDGPPPLPFEQVDANGDGVISEDEARAVYGMNPDGTANEEFDEDWNDADADGNGEVDQAEYDSAIERNGPDNMEDHQEGHGECRVCGLDHKHDIHRVLLDDLPYYQGHFFRLLNHTLLDQLHHFRQHRHHSNLHQILHLLYHQGSFHIQRVLHLQKLLHHRLHQLAQMVMAEDHLVLLLAVVVRLVGFVQRPLSMSLFQPLLTSLTSYHPP